MHRRRPADARQRPIERLDPVFARLLRPRLHPGLVDLHDIGAGREQILDLGVDRRRIVERQPLIVAIEIVLTLRRHGERPGHRHLDRPVGVGAQEFHVADLDRMLAPDRPHHPGHGRKPAGTVGSLAGIVEIDARERGGEAVGIALAALLAVGDDVEPGALLIADGEQRGVVLRAVELVRINAPEVVRAHARHLLGKLGPVDQPVRLGVGTDQGGG